MMRVPTEFDLQQMMHAYDPTKAHKYYEEHKKLKGRQRGAQESPSGSKRVQARQQQDGPQAVQKKELARSIRGLEQKLQKLDDLIVKRETEAASENRKGKAKQERAAKEKDKPKSVAAKAEAIRGMRKKELKHEDQKGSSKLSIDELKSLATKVRGQIAVAKQKLAAL